MHKFALSATCALAALPGLALAQAASPAPAAEPAATALPAPYAVAVEQVPLEKGKGGLLSDKFAAAGYNFSSSASVQNVPRALTINVFGATKTQKRVVVKYRFSKDGAPLDAGTCQVTADMWSGLWNQLKNSLYTCKRKPEEAGPADFMLEAAVPDVVPNPGWFLSLSEDKPVDFSVMQARMRWNGATYEAVPTGISLKQAERGYRAAKGWLITRDGQTVGRIDFPSREGGFTDMMGSYDRKSVLTAPVRPEDGREAVLVFAAHLMFLPEANSQLVQSS